MGSHSVINKAHAVCMPCPGQGHINPMLKVAKLLHHKGFYITFVNNEYNHQRLLKSRGSNALDGLPDFRFESIPDGLGPPDIDIPQEITALCESSSKYCLAPFRQLLAKLNASSCVPAVTCIVSDGCMSFTLDAAQELGIPDLLLWTPSACGFLAYCHFQRLIEKGFTPFKEESYLTNEHLDTVIDWIPGMKNIRIRDLPSFIRTTNPDDIVLNFFVAQSEKAAKASAIIVNTFDELEHDAIKALSSMFPRFYTIGPLHDLLLNHIPRSSPLNSIGSNLWKEEPQCLQWLNSKEPKSVIYVNFGSIAVMTVNQLTEFAWGLANSKQTFLWIIRPDLVMGDSAILPLEFIEETKERSLIASWCSQEEVLNHGAIACFLTHSGWNSTIESITSGVPMISWPFFAEQQTNCRYVCNEWGIGMEIDNDVKRNEVERQVRELMEGEKGKDMKNNVMELMEGDKGKDMKKNVMELKKKAQEAASLNGPSLLNLEILIKEVLLK